MEPETDAWLNRLAQELGVAPLTDTEKKVLLSASRRLAHGVERAATPLGAFLSGMGVATQTAAGRDRGQAFDRVIQTLFSQLPVEDP